ncbi:MAG: hypothetical protein P3B76_11955, partial [Gemmatimonadota bacterium]|nr:hypothetical protein [Gemmatimonadota bacterium]
VTTIASPRPFASFDGRDINLDNILNDDFIGGTVSSTGIRTTMPANEWKNWYRTVDIRLARPILNWNGKKVSVSAEAFNLFNWKNNLSFGSNRYTSTGAEQATFGVPTAAFAARMAQVGMRLDW